MKRATGIEDDRLAFITSRMPGDDLAAACNHHFMHVALHPYLAMSVLSSLARKRRVEARLLSGRAFTHETPIPQQLRALEEFVPVYDEEVFCGADSWRVEAGRGGRTDGGGDPEGRDHGADLLSLEGEVCWGGSGSCSPDQAASG
jgi:hypothetical protein